MGLTKRQTVHYFWVATLFVLFNLSYEVMAQSQTVKSFIVAMPDDDFFPQYSFKNGDAAGFLPSVINEFSKSSGIKFKISPQPIKRYLDGFYGGTVDFILPENPQWDPSGKKGHSIIYSKMIMHSSAGFVTRRGVSHLKEIKTVATVRGYTLPEIKDLSTVDVIYLNNTEAVLKFLAAKRADAGFCHLDIVRSILKGSESFRKNLIVKEDFPTTRYSYHLSTIKHPGIIILFDEWLAKNTVKIEALRNEMSCCKN